jgi:hypothetical protein
VNDKRSGSHGWLVPIIGVFLLSKAMHHGRRHRAWMHDASDGAAASAAGFRLPPKIEAMLKAWHEQAHQATDSTEGAAAASGV